MTTLLHKKLLKKSHFPDPLINIVVEKYLTDYYAVVVPSGEDEGYYALCPFCGSEPRMGLDRSEIIYMDHASKPVLDCCNAFIDYTCEKLENEEINVNDKFRILKIKYVHDYDLLYELGMTDENSNDHWENHEEYIDEHSTYIYGCYSENRTFNKYDESFDKYFIKVNSYSLCQVTDELKKRYGDNIGSDLW